MLVMNEKQKAIERVLSWIGDGFGYDLVGLADDIRNNKMSFSGTLSQYEVRCHLDAALKAYLQGEFDASFVKLRELLYMLAVKEKCDNTADSIRKYASMLNGVAENVEICEGFIESWKAENTDELRKAYPLFGSEMSLNAYDCMKIKNSIDSPYLRLYQYRKASVANKATKYKLSDGIVASDSLSDLITNTGLEDTWGVTLGLFLEEKIDLSYFVITFSLNGNVFVLTDRPVYKNPDQINRLRGGGRLFSEDRERYLDFLPYILIDKVIENRENSKGISKQAGSEIWTFPIKDYFCENLYYVIKYTIEKVNDGYGVKRLFNPDSDMRLLTDGMVDMSDDSHFIQTNMDVLNDIVDELYGERSQALVVRNGQLVEQMGGSTQLMTIDEIESNTQYLAHKQVVENHEKEKRGSLEKDSDEIYLEYRKQKEDLLSMFKEKSSMLEKYLFAGKKVSVHDIDHPVLYNGFRGSTSDRYKKPFVEHGTEFGSIVGRECLGGDGRMVEKEDYYKSFRFLRYTELTAILGIRREELPPLFRDYIANYYLPYIGNNILDNVKPEFSALEHDFVSRRNVNGFLVSFPYCGICIRKMYRRYMIAEEAVIVISGKQNRVLETLSKEEFLKKYTNIEEDV